MHMLRKFCSHLEVGNDFARTRLCRVAMTDGDAYLQCRRNAFLARTASRRLAKTFAARAQRNAISRLRYFSTGWPAEHPQRLWKKHGDDARCVRRVRRIVEGAGRRGQAATRAAGPGAWSFKVYLDETLRPAW